MLTLVAFVHADIYLHNPRLVCNCTVNIFFFFFFFFTVGIFLLLFFTLASISDMYRKVKMGDVTKLREINKWISK